MNKKTLILIGAEKGLGNVIAREFASNGFRVALVARNKEHLKEHEEVFQRLGYEVMTKQTYALYPETLTTAITEIERLPMNSLWRDIR